MQSVTRIRSGLRQRVSERGAVAVIVGVVAMVLFGTAAIAVDLGNAMVRKREVQSQADFAALGVGDDVADVPATPVDPDIVDSVAAYLNGVNQPQHDGDDCDVDDDCVIPAQLVDGDVANGEIEYTDDGLRVTAPPAHVSFGLAAALGFSAANVQARATVAAFSPGLGVMPSYAWKGCDWGPQYVQDDSTPLRAPLPVLDEPDDDNGVIIEEFEFDEATDIMSLTGNGLRDVTSIGFFREGDPSPADPILVAPSATPAPTNRSLTLVVPGSVTSTEAVWWVRAQLASDEWSKIDQTEMVAFPVGEVAPECDSESSEGNFGSLDIPRPSGDVSGTEQVFAKNAATSLEIRLQLYPEGQPECRHLGAPYYHVDDYPPIPANCVPVQTGFRNPGTTLGLVTGIDGEPGRIDVANGQTNDLCGGPSENETGILGETLNNDYLTCFFTNDTTTIADISRGSYDEGPVLSPEIFNSPRFMWLPIVKIEPSTGTGEYTLLDIRPAFLTDQPSTASGDDDTLGTSTTNGLYVDHGAVRAVKLVIFDIEALPQAADGTVVTPYIGVGPVLVRLID